MSKDELVAVELYNKEDFENYNFREKLKKSLRPYDYFKEIESLDFEDLTTSDRFFLQDFGIYNNELEEDDFTLRLRFPAGRISNEQLIFLSNMVSKYKVDVVLTARAGVQLHGFEAHNILDAYKDIENSGINTWQSFGDNVRNITTDVFDAVGIYNKIEVFPLIKQMQEFILKNPHYVGLLPRRLSVGICGSSATTTSFFASDIYFALAIKDDEYGFNVYLGGKNTELAKSTNIFLKKEQVVEFYIALVKAFNKHGSRLDRERNRLFHLLEDIGVEKFKEYIKEDFTSSWSSSGKTILEKIQTQDFYELKNNKYAFCYHSKFARIKQDELKNISEYVNKNNLELRFGTDQQIYILNLESKNIDLKHQNENRTIVACAGSEFCPYSYWSIKDELKYLPLKRIQKNRILMGFSGCLRGCAKHEHSDIGLVGLKADYLGHRVKTARIYLGALYTNGEALARKVFNKVPIDALHDILDLIIEEYEKSIYKNFEEFSSNVLNKYSVAFLNLWFLAKFNTKKEVYLNSLDEKELILNSFKNEEFIFDLSNDYEKEIEVLSQSLWQYSQTIEDKKLNKTYIMDHNA